jgi:Fe-S oxidoreductase
MKGSPAGSRARGRSERAVRGMARLSLSACVHCVICADSCTMFRGTGRDLTYSPSYKAINSIGRVIAGR